MVLYPQDDDEWVQKKYGFDTPSTVFGVLAPIADLWQSRRVDGNIPAWKDFQFDDFTGWYGWLCVFDATSVDPLEFSVRLWGTYIVDLMGYDMTGKHIEFSDTEPTDKNGGYLVEDGEFYISLINESAIGYTKSRLLWELRTHVWFEEIIIPLSGDGVSVDSFLSATRRIGDRPR